MLWILANEVMTFLTIIIVFPGFLPPDDALEWLMVSLAFLLMSLVWWVYLALAPFVFLFLYLNGDWEPSDIFDEWPWKQLAIKFGVRP